MAAFKKRGCRVSESAKMTREIIDGNNSVLINTIFNKAVNLTNFLMITQLPFGRSNTNARVVFHRTSISTPETHGNFVVPMSANNSKNTSRA